MYRIKPLLAIAALPALTGRQVKASFSPGCVTLLWQLCPIPWCVFFGDVFKALSSTLPRTVGAGWLSTHQCRIQSWG